MSIIQKLANFFSGRQVIDDFEARIIEAVVAKLQHEDAQAISDQVNLFNSSYRDFDEKKDRAYTYFYKMKFGKSMTDFPKKLSFRGEDNVFAVATVNYGEEVITASLHSVRGVFFFIEFASSGELYRPISPSFTVQVELTSA